MAKRKRLTPADPGRVDMPVTPEGKSAFPLGAAPPQGRAPISQVAADAAATAALEDLAGQMHQARKAGRLIQSIPEDQIESEHLVRDRVVSDDEDMRALKQSLKTRGQQTPVELVELEPGRYGLISGWRRLTALRQLKTETGDARFGEVLGILRQPDTAAEAYQAMVEENEIRVGLSYYERARIVAKAVEQGVYPDEQKALLNFFATASRAKRSKIKSFLPIYHALDEVLSFSSFIPERLGLQLSKALKAEKALGRRLRVQLAQVKPRTAEAELDCLKHGMQTAARNSASPPPALAESRATSVPKEVELIWSGNDLILRGEGVTPALARRLQTWLTE